MNPEIKILIVDDEPSIRLILAEHLKNEGFVCETAESGLEAIAKLKAHSFAAALVDVRLGDITGFEVLKSQNEFAAPTSMILMTAQDTIENAICAMRDGAYDYITKPVNLDEVTKLITKATHHFALLIEQLQRLQKREPRELQNLVGKSRAMLEIFKTVGRIADQDVPVLIEGESGTGKEMVARSIHQAGLRSTKNFVAINCAAIPEHLFESELFGFKKGAFTGADHDKPGLIEKAHGGTLFLDEIGEMPLSAQVKVLRFLQDKKFNRVGDAETKTLDVRILAATNRQLTEQIRQNHFREDLYFRINTVLLWVPPLRERQQDIPLLAEHFCQKYHAQLGQTQKHLSPEALNELKNRNWVGNVRELENAIKRLLVLSPSTVITAQDVCSILNRTNNNPSVENSISTPLHLGDPAHANWKKLLEESVKIFEQQLNTESREAYQEFLNAAEKPLLQAICRRTSGHQIKAAELLGINRNTLRRRLHDLGIE